jgi:group I intron endonuclease
MKKYNKYHKDDTSGIYQIYCEANNKSYIGQAFHIWSRLCSNHCRVLKNNKHPNKYLQAAWNKYGMEKFEWSVVKLCEIDKLNDEETSIIAQVGRVNLFNFTDGGEGLKGFIQTEEHRKKIAEARKGIKLNISEERREQLKIQCAKINKNEEYKEKRIQSRKDSGWFKNQEDFKQKSSESHKGKKHTPEQYAKISNFNKTDGAKQKYKPIERIDPITGEVKEYESIKAAAQEGFHAGHISDVLRGLTDTHKNYYWQFLNAADRKVNAKSVIRKQRIYKTQAVERIDMITGEVTEYNSLRDVERSGFDRRHVVKVCEGVCKNTKDIFGNIY